MFGEGHGMRQTSTKYLVLITDGKDNGSPVNYTSYAEIFRRKNIKRIVIGVGDGVDVDSLKQLVDDKINYYPADNFGALLKNEFISNIGICNGKILLAQFHMGVSVLSFKGD